MKQQEYAAEIADRLSRTKDLFSKTGSFNRFNYRKVLEADDAVRHGAVEFESKVSEWPSFYRETFSHLFDAEDCESLDSPSDFGQKVFNQLEAQGNWRELQIASQSHRHIAAQSTKNLCRAVAHAMKLHALPDNDDASSSPEEAQNLLDKADELGLDEETKSELQQEVAMGKARREAALANLTQSVRSGELAKSVQAIQQAAEKQAKAVGALRGFGLGGSLGDPDGDIPGELIDSLASDSNILDILSLVGRMKEAASCAEMSTGNSASGEIVGITTGDNVDKLIGSELAMLSTSARKDVIRRICESQALIWECEHDDKKSKGDMVILLDKSSSMYGEVNRFAYALAIASLTVAYAQKRNTCLVIFSNDVSSVVVRHNDKTALTKAIQMCTSRPCGGTDIIKALKHAGEQAQYLKDSDVLLITDACFPAPPRVITRAACGKDGRLFVVGLGAGVNLSMPDADKVWGVQDPTLENSTEILKTIK